MKKWVNFRQTTVLTDLIPKLLKRYTNCEYHRNFFPLRDLEQHYKCSDCISKLRFK